MNLEIPGLRFITGAPGTKDHRLKLLWFEDEDAFAVSSVMANYVCVAIASAPDPAAEILRRSRDDAMKHELDHDRLFCPPDLYIPDFDLGAAPAGHSPTDAGKATAAGLLSAMLMATTYPNHPATVLPFTGRPDQETHHYELAKLFSPPYVNVLWEYRQGKQSLGVAKVLRTVLIAHRKHLALSASRGLVHITYRERQRLVASRKLTVDDTITLQTMWGPRKILLGSLWPEHVTARDGNETLYGSVKQWVESFPVAQAKERAAAELAYTYFSLRLSGMSDDRYQLSDLIQLGVAPSDPDVRTLCDRIGLSMAAIGPYMMVMMEVRRLERMSTRTAERIKRAKESLRRARDDEKRDRAKVRARKNVDLLDELQDKLRVARSELKAKEMQLSLPKRSRCPQLLSREIGSIVDDETQRLSVLYLLILEESRRWALALSLSEELAKRSPELQRFLNNWPMSNAPYADKKEMEDLVRKVRTKAESLRADIELRRSDSRASIRPEIEATLNALASVLDIEVTDLMFFLGRLDDHAYSWFASAPLTPRATAQLIDPLPEQVLTADAKFREQRVGQGLARLGLNVSEILAPRGYELPINECVAVVRFAHELAFPRSEWPSWLRGLHARALEHARTHSVKLLPA